MSKESILKDLALSWFQNESLEILGPFDLNVQTDEELNRTTFKINLTQTPPLIYEMELDKEINEDTLNLITLNLINKNINLYLDTVEDRFIEVLCYLGLSVSSDKYSQACEIANFLNINSNTYFIQVFPQEETLNIRIKVATSAIGGVGNDDFYILITSVILSTYNYWSLFSILEKSNESADKIIAIFQNS